MEKLVNQQLWDKGNKRPRSSLLSEIVTELAVKLEKLRIQTDLMMNVKHKKGEGYWRDGCSSRGPEINSGQPHDCSQLSVTAAPGNLVPQTPLHIK